MSGLPILLLAKVFEVVTNGKIYPVVGEELQPRIAERQKDCK